MIFAVLRRRGLQLVFFVSVIRTPEGEEVNEISKFLYFSNGGVEQVIPHESFGSGHFQTRSISSASRYGGTRKGLQR